MQRLKLRQMLEPAWDTARRRAADLAMEKTLLAAALPAQEQGRATPQVTVREELAQVQARDAAVLVKVQEALRDEARALERARAVVPAADRFRESQSKVERTRTRMALTLRHSRSSRKRRIT